MNSVLDLFRDGRQKSDLVCLVVRWYFLIPRIQALVLARWYFVILRSGGSSDALVFVNAGIFEFSDARCV